LNASMPPLNGASRRMLSPFAALRSYAHHAKTSCEASKAGQESSLVFLSS
jgi:hypothetical protein